MSRQSRQSQDHSTDTHQRLIEAALLTFAEKGFDGASVREIAQRAKANPAMIAYHFGSKDGLYEAAMRWVCSDFASRVQRMIEAACPEPTSDTALGSVRAIVGDLFKSVVICGHGQGQCIGQGLCSPEDRRRRGMLHDAGHRLWDQEMSNPRASLLDFIIEQIRVPMERIVACINLLRPELSGLELDTMLMGIHGAVFLFHKHYSFIEKIRGVAYSGDDLERMAEYFVDFCIRGLGIPSEAAS